MGHHGEHNWELEPACVELESVGPLVVNPVPREADSSDCRALFYFQEISPSVFQQLTPRLPVMNDMIIHHNGPVKCFEKREEVVS